MGSHGPSDHTEGAVRRASPTPQDPYLIEDEVGILWGELLPTRICMPMVAHPHARSTTCSASTRLRLCPDRTSPPKIRRLMCCPTIGTHARIRPNTTRPQYEIWANGRYPRALFWAKTPNFLWKLGVLSPKKCIYTRRFAQYDPKYGQNYAKNSIFFHIFSKNVGKKAIFCIIWAIF